MQERLQKIISAAGIASRRCAEDLIVSGEVKVNGQTVTQLGSKADPKKDKIEVSGHLISSSPQLFYLAMYKPAGYVCTRRDELNRKTIYDLLDKKLVNKIWNVGRLDKDSEGLLILTNDGELTQKLTHPSFGHEKEYKVFLNKEPQKKDLKRLEQGIKIDGYKTNPAQILSVEANQVDIIINEGKKRQLRRMFDSLGFKVERLIRIREGKLSLKDLNLSAGEIKEVKKSDII